MVLWGGDDQASALAIAGGMRRNTRLYHVPTLLYLRHNADLNLSEAYNRGVTDVAALIDLKAEIARLEKEIARHKGDIAGIEKKLSIEQFVAKAPPEVIEEQHTRRSAAETALVKLGDALVQLKAAG